MATSVLDVVRLSTRYLAGHGSESARLDAELITAHGLGLRRLDLYLQHDRPLGESELAPVRAMLRRRVAGEPVAYLTGRREFFGRSFAVSPAVLVPRPETETLVAAVLAWARDVAGARGDGLRIADLGTGSGCIAVSLAAELAGAVVSGVDVSAPALAVAAENAAAHGVADRVELLEGRWCAPLRGDRSLDALVANPPYVPSAEIAGLMPDVRDHEPRAALDGGADGLDATRALLESAAAAVRPGGLVALEIDHRAGTAVVGLVEATWPGTATRVLVDLAGHDRVVIGSVRG